MKKPEEYIQDAIDNIYECDQPYFDNEVTCIYDGNSEAIFQAIKQAQIDAIEETCRVCAEEAQIKHDYYDYDTPELYKKYKHDGFERCDGDGIQYGVDIVNVNKQSILSVADKLKKEL